MPVFTVKPRLFAWVSLWLLIQMPPSGSSAVDIDALRPPALTPVFTVKPRVHAWVSLWLNVKTLPLPRPLRRPALTLVLIVMVIVPLFVFR